MDSPTTPHLTPSNRRDLGLADLSFTTIAVAFVAAVPVAGALWWWGTYPFMQAFFGSSLLVLSLALAAAIQLYRASRQSLHIVPPMICAGVAVPLAVALALGVTTYTPPSSPYGALASAAAFGPAPNLLPAGRDWYEDSPVMAYESTCVASHSGQGATGAQRVSLTTTVSGCSARAIDAGGRVDSGIRH